MKKHDLVKPKVLLAFPTYEGKQRFETSMCILDLTRIMDKIEFTFTALPQDAAIGRLRNHAAWFLLEKTDCDYMLQIDHDITFSTDDILRILNHGEDIVGGLYPAKQINKPRWIVTGIEGEQPDERGLEKCMEIGTGFLLTHRSVFEKMRAAYPEEAYHCDADPARPLKHDFFKFGVVNKRYLSEDYYFCYRARCLGFDIYADHGVKLGHIGPHEFKGPPTEKKPEPPQITTEQTVLP